MIEQQRLLAFVGLILAGWLVHLLAPVLVPLFVAAILAYLGDPLVDRLEARRLSRTIAVTIVFVGIFTALSLVALVILPLLERQIIAFGQRLPQYLDWAQETLLPWLYGHLGLEKDHLNLSSIKSILIQHLDQAGGIVQTVLSSVSKSGMALIGWAANLVLIPVVTFYLLRDWDRLIEHVESLVPRKNVATIRGLASESDQVLGAFLRGQMTVMLALGTIYSIGLWIVGIDLALLIGMLAGLVSFVPYLGFFVGFVMAGVMALIQFQELLPLVWVLAVFGIGQLLEGVVLTPLLVGDKTGLHPVVVIFSVLIGGQLFGFVGILLALPAAAVLLVLLRHVHTSYVSSSLYGEDEEQPESSRD